MSRSRRGGIVIIHSMEIKESQALIFDPRKMRSFRNSSHSIILKQFFFHISRPSKFIVGGEIEKCDGMQTECLIVPLYENAY